MSSDNSINVNDSNLNVNTTVNNHSFVVDSSNNSNNSNGGRLVIQDETEKREREAQKATKMMYSRQKSLQDVYNKWYGLDLFYNV